MAYNREELDRIQTALDALWQTLSRGEPVAMPLETQRCYVLALNDLTAEQIETACGEAMRQCRWFPKPVELRELLFGSIDQRAEQAYCRVLDAIESQGAYRSVTFPGDPAISHAIAACGGWERVCDTPVQWLRRDFIASYRNLAAKQQKPIAIAGIHERNNRIKTGDVVKIGDIYGSSLHADAQKRHLTHEHAK